MLSAILQGIAAGIYNQVLFGNKTNKIDNNTRVIMKCFKPVGQDMSVYHVSGDIHVVYIGNIGYLFNLKTKKKCLCNPNGQLIRDNFELVYSNK